ncbi:MAG: hypothetical protein U0414_22415 [Polyangiaceae bacterium]
MATVRINIVAKQDSSVKQSILDYAASVERADRAIVASAQRASKGRAKAADATTREFAREQVRQTVIAQRETEKRASAEMKASRAVERQRQRDVRESQAIISRVSREAVANVTKVGKAVIGLAVGGASAIGVDTSLTSIVGKSVRQQKSVVDIANTGSASGAATPQEIEAVNSALSTAANKTKIDIAAMTAALDEYVSITGNMGAGIKALEAMGVMARATGASVEDIAAAQASVDNLLGDAPDKVEQLDLSMRRFAKIAKDSSINFRELSKYIVRPASKGFMFEGDASSNMATLTGAATIATRGGAASAAEATTSAGNLPLDLAENADAILESIHLDVFADKSRKKLKSLDKLMPEILRATQGDLSKLGDLGGRQSLKTLMGFTDVYNKAGGGEAGEKAVRDKIRSFTEALDSGAIQRAFENSANTIEAKTTQFNNQMQERIGKIVEQVMPALEQLAPSALQLASSFAELAPALASALSWAANDPFGAVTVALVASVAKASIGEAIKTAILGGLNPPGGGPGGPGGVKNALGAPLATASFGVGMETGKEVVDIVDDANKQFAAYAKILETSAFGASEGVNAGNLNSLGKLLTLLPEMRRFGDRSKLAGPLDPISDHDAWNRNIDILEAEKKKAMMKLSPEQLALAVTSQITGKNMFSDQEKYVSLEEQMKDPNFLSNKLFGPPDAQDGGAGKMVEAADAHSSAAEKMAGAADRLVAAADSIANAGGMMPSREGTTR